MASQSELETLRQLALDEWSTATREEREIDKTRLDSVGYRLLGRHSPVACTTEEALYYDAERTDATVTPIKVTSTIAGRFGGFCVYSHFDGSPEDENNQVAFRTLNYFIEDTRGRNRGFLCEVGSSTLVDVTTELTGDHVFDQMRSLLEEKVIDVHQINALFMGLKDDTKLASYATYIKTMLAPSDVWINVLAREVCANDKDGNETFASDFAFGERFEQIYPDDVFVVGKFSSLGPDVELAVRRSSIPHITIPLSCIIGVERLN